MAVKVPVHIRPVEPEDSAIWEEMRQELWPSLPGEHKGEIARFFQGEGTNPAEAFLALTESEEAAGFIELSIRSYAEGCFSGRVAYIEGWFVKGGARRGGVGAALVRAAEAWGQSQGCSELASDAEIDNALSITAHKALGFTEVGRIVCFRKDLYRT